MKMYIIVRSDISKSYQAAQGGHALAQMALDWPDKFKEWNNHTIVYLKTSYEDLQRIASSGILNELDCVFSDFYEPDINNELTAISIYGLNAGIYLKDYRLL